jgi:hypothetical protein
VVRLPLRSPTLPSDDGDPDNRRDWSSRKRSAPWPESAGGSFAPASLAMVAAA